MYCLIMYICSLKVMPICCMQRSCQQKRKHGCTWQDIFLTNLQFFWLSVAAFCNLVLCTCMPMYERTIVLSILKWSVSYSKGIEI